MASNEDLPEVTEQLMRLAEKEMLNRRLVRGALLTVVSGAAMTVGIKVIGISHEWGFETVYWNTS